VGIIYKLSGTFYQKLLTFIHGSIPYGHISFAMFLRLVKSFMFLLWWQGLRQVIPVVADGLAGLYG